MVQHAYTWGPTAGCGRKANNTARPADVTVLQQKAQQSSGMPLSYVAAFRFCHR